MVPGYIYTQNALDYIKNSLTPKILCFEETQEDIDKIIKDISDSENYEPKKNNYLQLFKSANTKTLNTFIVDEITFYNTLNGYKCWGTEIIGLDNADFDSTGYEEAEEIYFNRKHELLSEILSLDSIEAEARVIKESKATLNHQVVGDEKPYYIVSDSEALTDYYTARDSDTEKNLRDLIAQEETKPKSDETSIVYFCNISHFDDGYQNLLKNIQDLNPKVMLMCDFL